MAAEAKAFTEFMQKANDSEKAMLRLETDKLKRAESEWVHVLVRMLDHVYALHIGAMRSGQPKFDRTIRTVSACVSRRRPEDWLNSF